MGTKDTCLVPVVITVFAGQVTSHVSPSGNAAPLTHAVLFADESPTVDPGNTDGRVHASARVRLGDES